MICLIDDTGKCHMRIFAGRDTLMTPFLQVFRCLKYRHQPIMLVFNERRCMAVFKKKLPVFRANSRFFKPKA